jgi:hypothetical protein
VDRPQGDGHRTPPAPVDGPAATVHRCGEGAARDVHRYPSGGVRDRCADKAHRQRIFTGVARVLRGAQFHDCCGRVRMGWSHSRCRCWPHWSEGKRRAEPPAWLVTTGDQTWDVAIEGEAQVSAEPDQIKHIAARIANRYYPFRPAEAFAESFVQASFTTVRISITNVIARSGLGDTPTPAGQAISEGTRIRG